MDKKGASQGISYTFAKVGVQVSLKLTSLFVQNVSFGFLDVHDTISRYFISFKLLKVIPETILEKTVLRT